MSQEFNEKRFQELVSSANTIAVTANLIQQGLFQGAAVAEIKKSMDFLQAMHDGVMAELEPLIKQREQIMEAREKAAVAQAEAEKATKKKPRKKATKTAEAQGE